MLNSLSLSKTLPVGTSDAGAYFNNEVLGAVDYGVCVANPVWLIDLFAFQMANVHPWFANVSAEDGAGWTAQFFQTIDVDVANALPNKPKMYIAETGTLLHLLVVKNICSPTH